MILRVISDLHYEFYETPRKKQQFWLKFREWAGNVQPNDVLLLAGDLCTAFNSTGPNRAYEELLTALRGMFGQVIFVAGNHEYYGSSGSRAAVVQRLEQIAQATGCVFLHRKSIQLSEQLAISGATLWSHIDSAAVASMNDFHPKNGFSARAEYIAEHLADVAWLSQLRVATPHHVILTHHLPSLKLIHPKYDKPELAALNTGFATDILPKLDLTGVDYIFSGHTHEHVSYQANNTLCFVNPLGYPGEPRTTKLQRGEFEL